MQGDKVAEFSSGAVRSGRVLPWWMLPWDALELIVQRFQNGQDKGYGIHNWKKAIKTGDLEFIRQLYDHTQGHLKRFLMSAGEMETDEEGETPLTHLAAAGWGILALLTFTLHDRENVMKAFQYWPSASQRTPSQAELVELYSKAPISQKIARFGLL